MLESNNLFTNVSARYDFDRDGYIIPEDVRLILSHVPIENSVIGNVAREGTFTQMGGGSQVFLDRLQNQTEIQNLIDEVFGTKKRIDLEEYKRINTEVTSEMFLSVLILLQNSLPCTENFYRYQKNFEKYISPEAAAEGEQASGEPNGKVKTIASPRMMSNSPLASLAKQHGINFAPQSQNNMLKHALTRPKEGGEEGAAQAEAADGNNGEVDVAKFNTAKADQAAKKARQLEVEKLIEEGKDVVNEEDAAALRLPNAIKKAQGMKLSTDPNAPTQQMVMSPTSFLTGQPASPRLASFQTNDSQSVQIEGEMIRKASDTKLKKYWYCLLGKELYVYKNKNEERHKSMHSLVGVFLKDEGEEQFNATTVLYSFKLIFPPNKARSYYFADREEKERWIESIKKVIGYSNVFDYYEIKQTLGKGKFGLVKSAIHKKSHKAVAIKVMQKKQMSVQDVELQRREIEILKMCQHPHIIRLLDIFEN